MGELERQLLVSQKGDLQLSFHSLEIRVFGVCNTDIATYWLLELTLHSSGSMIHKAGAGPKPIPQKELNVKSLTEAIKFAISPPAKEAAKILAKRIHDEVPVHTSLLSVLSDNLLVRMESNRVLIRFINIFLS